MNDHGKPRNDKTQQDEQAHDLIEQLNLLEAVDHRITPEHVAKRFRELLDDIGDDGPPSPAADQHPRGILDQPGCGPQLTEYTAEHWADLLGLSGSLEAAIAAARSAAADIIADAQLKAKTVSDELRRTQEAVAAARQQAEQILVEARTEADEALERAVKMIRDAGEQAAQIINHARQEAEQIITAAHDQQVQQTAWAGHDGALNVFRPPARRLTLEAAAIRNLTDRTFCVVIDYMGHSVTAEVRTDQYPYPTDRTSHGRFDLPTAPDGIIFAAGHGSRQTVGGLSAWAGELFGLADSRLHAFDPWQNTVNAYSGGLLGTAATVAPTLPGITGQFYQAFRRAFDRTAVYNRGIDARRDQSILELAASRDARLVGIGGVEGTVWVPNLAIEPGLRILAGVGDECAARHVAELLAQHGDLDRLRTLADAGDEYAATLLAELAARSPTSPAKSE